MTADLPGDSDVRFGQLVVSQGLVTPDQLRECLRLRFERVAEGSGSATRLAALLVERGYLTAEQCTRALLLCGAGTSESPRAIPPEAALAAADPSRILGRYVRVDRLGEGGMGEVWRAWDCELGRWVALKILKAGNHDELVRFQRESRVIARLPHPNIAAIYDVGEHGGRPYIVMQLVEGKTLDKLPQQDRAFLVWIVRVAAEAVQYAHDQGIIHRDLKPQNIMVEGQPGHISKSTKSGRPRSPSARVYVMDFGLAREVAVSSSLSVAGHLVGTPPYMSPEQIRGRGEELSVRSDIYSLGVTLYEAVAGRPPFTGQDPYELFRKIVEKEPPPLRRFEPKVDRDLELIVHKCLEKDPERRYATAKDLAEDLERYLDGEAILARRASGLYRFRMRIRKSPATSLAMTGAVLAVALAAGFLTQDRSQRRDEREQAAASRTGSLEASELCRRATESLREARSLLRTRTSRRDQWERLFAQARRLAEAAVQRDPALAAAHYMLGEQREAEGAWAEALPSFDQALALDPKMAAAWYHKGICHLQIYMEARMGQALLEAVMEGRAGPDAAESGQKAAALEALRTHARLQGERPEVTTDFLTAQAAVAIAEARYDDAQGFCDHVLALTQTDEQVWMLLARAKYHRRDYRGAIATLDVLIADVMPQSAEAYALRAAAQEKLKDFRAALEDATRSVDRNPRNAGAWVTRAWARNGLEDYPGTVEDATRALQLDPGSLPASFARAWGHERQGRLAEADLDYGRMTERRPEYALPYTLRGWVRERLGRWEAAAQDYDEAIQRGQDGSDDHANSGRARFALGEWDAAQRAFGRALDLKPRDAGLHIARGKARLGLKEWTGARADFTRAIELDPALRSELAPLLAQCEKGP